MFVRATNRKDLSKKVGFYGYGPVRFEIDPAQLGRSDWWAYTGDSYGTTSPSAIAKRSTVETVGTERQYLRSSNEIMFDAGIPKSAIRRVYVDGKKNREQVIADLRDAGFSEINGRKLEDFVVLQRY